jgi:hypothetical protein
MRTRIGSDVAEAEHVQVPAATSHGRQTRHVVSPLVAIERVEQPAIERRLEHSAETVQVQRIANHEVGIYTATGGLLPRDRHCGLRHIDSQNGQPPRSNVQGVLAGPASCIENCAGECALPGQAQDRRLWLSSVPGRRAIEVRRIPGLARPPLVTGWLPPAVRIVGCDSCLLGHLRLIPRTGATAALRTRIHLADLSKAIANAGGRSSSSSCSRSVMPPRTPAASSGAPGATPARAWPWHWRRREARSSGPRRTLPRTAAR